MSGSSTIPSTPVTPFCDASGFLVTTTVGYENAVFADIFVLVEATLKGTNPPITRFETFPGGESTYFSDIISNDPNLAGISYPIHSGTVSIYYKMFHFRVSVPKQSSGVQAYTFPFVFAPNWFFGDVPWKVYTWASGSNDATVIAPSISQVLVEGIPIGALNFTAPYYPIVGSQNVSSHYTNLTTLFSVENNGKAASIMLLPDASGNPPTLTIDVPNLHL